MISIEGFVDIERGALASELTEALGTDGSVHEATTRANSWATTPTACPCSCVPGQSTVDG